MLLCYPVIVSFKIYPPLSFHSFLYLYITLTCRLILSPTTTPTTLLGPGPSTLYMDVAGYLLDARSLRNELELYAEALHPYSVSEPFSSRFAKHTPHCYTEETRGEYDMEEREENRESRGEGYGVRRGTKRRFSNVECESRSISDSCSDLDSVVSTESVSVSPHSPNRGTFPRDPPKIPGHGIRGDSQKHSSYIYTSRTKRCRPAQQGNILEDIRLFTSFAALRLQEVASLYAEEVEAAQKRGEEWWEAGAGVQVVQTLSLCASEWLKYSKLYK